MGRGSGGAAESTGLHEGVWSLIHERLQRWRVVPAAIALLCLFNWSNARWLRSLFWDLRVYLETAQGHVDAYEPTTDRFKFVYHPLVLHVFRFLDHAGLPWVLVTFYGLSLLAFFHAVRSMQGAGRGFLLAACFGELGTVALGSGNITTYLHFVTVAALLLEARRGSIRWSWVVIGACSLIKPYFLAYCFVPFLLDSGTIRRKLAASVAVGAALIGVLLSYQAARPELTARFYRTLSQETLGTGDIGYSFFHWLMALTGQRASLSLVLHSLLSLGLVLWLLRLRARAARSGISALHLVLLGYFVMTVINPRMKEYDAFPAAVCLFIFVATVLRERARPVFLAEMLVVAVPFAGSILLRRRGVEVPRSLYNQAVWLSQMVGLGALLATVSRHVARAGGQADGPSSVVE